MLPLIAQIEEVQAPEAPRSWHASSHLLDGIALGTAAVRLRVSRYSSEHLVGIYHWQATSHSSFNLLINCQSHQVAQTYVLYLRG